MEYRSRRLFDGKDMPRKRLEGRSLRASGLRKITTTPNRRGENARPVATGCGTLAPCSGPPPAQRRG
ncbi:hypothetical protein EYY95_11620 [Hafnia alvei]|nr:hypothetical protein EYY95_11620 [Hafnia alvei]